MPRGRRAGREEPCPGVTVEQVAMDFGVRIAPIGHAGQVSTERDGGGGHSDLKSLCPLATPLSSHTARVPASSGQLITSQPELGGMRSCEPILTGTLDATAADRASGSDSTSVRS